MDYAVPDVLLADHCGVAAAQSGILVDVEQHPYSRMQREPLRPFEVTILRALDVAFLEAVRTGREQKVSARPFSLNLFDAWFDGDKPATDNTRQ